MAIDYSTDVGKFRLIFPDDNESAPIFTDAQVQGFLDLEGDVRRAKGLALRRAAAKPALRAAVVQLFDMRLDGAAAAKALLALAEAEYAAAADSDARAGDAFDIAEMVPDAFAARERLRDQVLRGVF